MALLKSTLVLSLVASVFAQNCTSRIYNCPATGSFDVCANDSLQNYVIIRCVDGCPQTGNCNDNLAGVPPVGVKTDALCYQDSTTAGNAQCTFNCVSVEKLDGSSFYPVGCTSQSSSSISRSSTSKSNGSSSSKTGSSISTTSGSASSTTSSSVSSGHSTHMTYSTTTTSTGGSGGTGGNGGHGGQGGVVSSTTYSTTTLPGGKTSVGSSVVVVVATGTLTPALSNDGNGLKAEWFVVPLVGGLIALV